MPMLWMQPAGSASAEAFKLIFFNFEISVELSKNLITWYCLNLRIEGFNKKIEKRT